MSKNQNLRRKVAMFTIHSDPLAHLGSQEAGGQNIYIRNVAEKLGKLGWEIDIFTRWDDPKKKQIVQLTKKEIGRAHV